MNTCACACVHVSQKTTLILDTVGIPMRLYVRLREPRDVPVSPWVWVSHTFRIDDSCTVHLSPSSRGGADGVPAASCRRLSSSYCSHALFALTMYIGSLVPAQQRARRAGVSRRGRRARERMHPPMHMRDAHERMHMRMHPRMHARTGAPCGDVEDARLAEAGREMHVRGEHCARRHPHA